MLHRHSLPLLVALIGLSVPCGSSRAQEQAFDCPPTEVCRGEVCRGHCGHAWCECLRQRAPWDMPRYGRQAAGTFFDALNAQSMNGRALELTLWNHYFEPRSAALLPSGVAYLNRMARRQPPQADFLVLLETAHDIEYTPDQVAGFAARCDQLDANRVAAVREYVTKVLRRPSPQILLHNPPRVGMPADEATSAYAKLISQGPQGVLSGLMLQDGEIAAPPLP